MTEAEREFLANVPIDIVRGYIRDLVSTDPGMSIGSFVFAMSPELKSVDMREAYVYLCDRLWNEEMQELFR